MGARDARERCLEVYKEEKRKVKRCIYQSKEEVQEQFGRMNQDVNGNRKLSLKEVSEANGGKVENSNGIKDGNVTLVLEEAEVRRIWKEYYEDMYNNDTIIIIWGVYRSRQHSRCYIAAEHRAALKIRHYYYYLGSISQQAALHALYRCGRQSRVKEQT